MKKLVLHILFLVCTGAIGLSQVNQPQPESVQLFTDRDIYITGEKIWFQAVVNPQQKNSENSNILYIEIFDDESNPVVQQKHLIEDKVATGFIALPENQFSGNFLIRAYTLYQRNFQPLNYAHQLITLINPKEPLGAGNGNLDFFVVQDAVVLDSLIRCVAYTGDNMPVEPGASAWITATNDSAFRANVTLTNSGLAAFQVAADFGRDYVFNVVSPEKDTLQQKFTLLNTTSPELRVEENENHYQVWVESIPAGTKTENASLTIYDSKGIVLEKGNLKLSKEDATYALQVARTNISEGYVAFVLRDVSGEIIAQELSHTFPAWSENKIIDTDKTVYPSGSVANINIKTSEAIHANLRMVPAAALYKQKELVRQAIYNPALIKNVMYNDHFSKEEQNLLFTLIEDKVIDELVRPNTSANKTTFQKESDGLVLRALVRNIYNKKPLVDIPVYLSVLGKGGYFLPQKSDENGSLSFTLYNLEREQRIFLTVPPEYKDSTEVLIQNDFSTEAVSFPVPPLNLGPKDKTVIEELMVNAQLGKITNLQQAKEKKLPEFPEKFYGEPETHIVLEDYIALPTLEEIFHEIVTNAAVRNKKGNPYFVVFENNNLYSYENPLVMLDNVPVSNYQEILNIPPSKVKYVDVVNKIYIVGNFVFRGIISIHTHKSDFGGYTFPDEVLYVNYQTTTPAAELRLNKMADLSPDFRNLVLWENNTTKNEISVHLPQNTGKFKLLYWGVSGNKIVTEQKTIEIKKESHQAIMDFP